MSLPVRIMVVVDPQTEPVVRWLGAGGWCAAVEIRPGTPAERIRFLQSMGMGAVMHLHAHPGTRARQAADHGRAEPDPAATIAEYLAAVEGNGVWQVLIEDDSAGVGFSHELLKAKPKTSAEAMALFDAYLDTTLAEAAHHFHGEKWGLAGFAMSAHAYAAHGVDCVVIERANDDVEDFQTAVAFARGAARQFGCQWGIDFSLWWGVIYGCIQDHPASFHRRNLYLAAYSGATACLIEGGDLLLRGLEEPKSDLVRTLDAFGTHIRQYPLDRPDTPVAVLLPRDHGWTTPAYWDTRPGVWTYARIAPRPGHRGITGFFGAAFPGSAYAMDPFPLGSYEEDNPPASPFSLSCVTPRYAPSPGGAWTAEPPIPFGQFANRDAAREALASSETSPYRPMGDARWGDIIDVLTEEATPAVLAEYPVLVALGPLVVDDALLSRLRDYVGQGGTLLWAAGVARPGHSELTGTIIEPELRVGRAWAPPGGAVHTEPFRYCPAQVTSASVHCATPGGDPLVVENQVGKGRVVTCLVPWFEGLQGLAGPALALFDAEFGKVQPATVEGLPVEWLTTSGEGRRTIIVANHDAHPWEGTVTLCNVPRSWTRCTERMTGEAVPFEHTSAGTRARLEIPAFGLRILCWET